MTRDDIDAVTGEADDLADKIEFSPDLIDPKYYASFLRRMSVLLIQTHQSLVNEAYRSQGFKPWMRSSKMRKNG